MGNYLTVSNLRSTVFPGGKIVDFSNYTNSQLETIIGRVETLIERITNDIFYPKTETYFFDGSGKPELYFTPLVPYKLLTLTSAQEVDDDPTKVLDTLTENKEFKKFPHALVMFSDYDTRRKKVLRGEWFVKGLKNYKLTGVWGNLETPKEIEYVTALLAGREIDPTTVQLSPSNVKRIDWPDFEIEFRSDASAEVYKQSTGFLEIDRILARYINYSNSFVCV